MDSFANRLYQERTGGSKSVLNRADLSEFLSHLLCLLFPHFSRQEYSSAKEISAELIFSKNRLIEIICKQEREEKAAQEISNSFYDDLENIYNLLLLDARAIFEGDPAARSVDEVILSYPGFHAICVHRLAHGLYTRGTPELARVLSEFSHERTGIDIHPGALIGKSFCIDHGTGIVIGETTDIKEHVKIYQGVTLGALSVDKSLASKKRHPTIEKNVVIYSNATILGGGTVIGENSVIGGNVWITASVPANSTVYHKSEIHFKSN